MTKSLHLAPADAELKGIRDGFGLGLVEVARLDPRVVVLSADLTESIRLEGFAKEFPERFVELGVAEQNMAGVAAGLALSGKVPFIASYAVFNPGRNWDQLRVSICYSQANVKVIGAHAGISVGPDGATHQALEDLAITRVLPDLLVLAPTDFEEARKAVHAMVAHEGPVYVRFGREKTPQVTTEKTPFALGKVQVLKAGKDVTVLACGAQVHDALRAAELLKKRTSVEVLAVSTIKPLDSKAILTSAKKTGRVVVVEEHQVTGGLGGAVCELLSQHCPVPVRLLGVPDTFGESGSAAQLLEKFSLTPQGVVGAIEEVLCL